MKAFIMANLVLVILIGSFIGGVLLSDIVKIIAEDLWKIAKPLFKTVTSIFRGK